MSVYFLQGKLGSGKTLYAVARIRESLKVGKRVATNLDLKLEKMLPRNSDASVIRLPDKPRLEDLKALGYGCDKSDYTNKLFGLIVLDELGTWFNSRTWNDKERLPVIDWFLHARKYRWDIIFIVQDISSIDAQLRESLCEFNVKVRGTRTLPIPLFGQIFRIFGIKLTMPAGCVATTRYAQQTQGPPIDRKWYRGKDLFSSYDTGQVFRDGKELVGQNLMDFRSISSYLPPRLTTGRYFTPYINLPIYYLPFLVIVALPYAMIWAAVRGVSLSQAGQILGLWSIKSPVKSF